MSFSDARVPGCPYQSSNYHGEILVLSKRRLRLLPRGEEVVKIWEKITGDCSGSDQKRIFKRKLPFDTNQVSPVQKQVKLEPSFLKKEEPDLLGCDEGDGDLELLSDGEESKEDAELDFMQFNHERTPWIHKIMGTIKRMTKGRNRGMRKMVMSDVLLKTEFRRTDLPRESDPDPSTTVAGLAERFFASGIIELTSAELEISEDGPESLTLERESQMLKRLSALLNPLTSDPGMLSACPGSPLFKEEEGEEEDEEELPCSPNPNPMDPQVFREYLEDTRETFDLEGLSEHHYGQPQALDQIKCENF